MITTIKVLENMLLLDKPIGNLSPLEQKAVAEAVSVLSLLETSIPLLEELIKKTNRAYFVYNEADIPINLGAMSKIVWGLKQ